MLKTNFLIITEDLVFKEILHRLICNNMKGANFVSIQSYEVLIKSAFKSKMDIVILDDTISDATYSEVLNYLRIDKEIVAPMYLFSTADYIEKLAYSNGIDFFFKKPFDPQLFIDQIILTIQANTKK